MRALRIACGVAILFITLAYAHLMHHHLLHASTQDHADPVFWVLVFLALGAGILSLIGAVLLLQRSR
jgi:hypothetical protein